MREVDGTAHDQPADRTEQRPDPARRRRRDRGTGGGAAPADRVRDPADRAVPAPDDPGERGDGTEAARLAAGADPGAGRRAAGPGRPGTGPVREALSARAVRRPAAAGRGGPGTGGRSGG